MAILGTELGSPCAHLAGLVMHETTYGLQSWGLKEARSGRAIALQCSRFELGQ